MNTGRLVELWRHPVKSMGGERLRSVTLQAAGVPGDRAWAAWLEDGSGPLSAKEYPALMRCRARQDQRAGERFGPPEIELPDGSAQRAGTRAASAALTELLGRNVTLWPWLPPPLLDALEAGESRGPASEAALRAVLGLDPAEPLPVAAEIPEGLTRAARRDVGLQDAAPLLLVTTASLSALESLLPDARIDVRRFRPNLVVANDGPSGFVERGWIGKTLRIGDAELEIVESCRRCVMTGHGFDDVPEAPEVLRTLTAQVDGRFGVYARVVTRGTLDVGDPVAL